ncbi:MAG: hypothetical protein WDW38_011556 [Sanguina aurantia]
MTAADEGSVPLKGSRIQVVVRVRPVLTLDSGDQVAVTCSPDGSKVQVLLPERSSDKSGPPGAARAGARAYEFDACLPGATTQAELFETCGMAELVEAALDGYSVTVFAFGQTGSGKTHTMIGPRLSRPGEAAASTGLEASSSLAVDEEDGVLARCITYAYTCIAERAAVSKFNVSASCVELYNECVTDLLGLDKNKTLHVRKDARGGFQVGGLTQLSCPGAASASRYIQRAMVHRHTRSHKLNEYSSRSHCLTTFVFASQELLQQGEGEAGSGARGVRRYGKLCLVDLAGSERLKATGNTEREAVRETGAINKSLFTLGQVLNALSSRSAAPVFAPYRDSKLTQLLWDGLKGSGRALMLACLGPLRAQSEESLNTLHFASMARRIKAAPIVLLDPQVSRTIQDLRKENQQLAVALTQLSTASENGGDSSSSSRALQLFQSLPEGLQEDALREAKAEKEAAAQRPAGISRSGHSAAASDDLHLDGWNGSPSPGRGKDQSAVHEKVPMYPNNPSPSRRNSRMLQGSAKSSSGYSPLAAAAAAAGSLNYAYHFARIVSPEKRAKGAGTGGDNRRRSSSLVPSDPFLQRNRSRATSGGMLPPVNSIFLPSKPGNTNGNYASWNPISRQARHSSADPTSPGPQPTGLAKAGSNSSMLPAPTPLADSFPELAAMEAAFLQGTLTSKPDVSARRPGRSSASSVPGLSPLSEDWQHGGPQDPDLETHSQALEDEAGAGEVVAADVRALEWASRNTWFGSDVDMTTLAYEAHDQLVDVQHLDPSSDEYYSQIEKQVAAAFPAKWNTFLRHHASRTAQQQAARHSSPSKGHTYGFIDGNYGPNTRISSPSKAKNPSVGLLNTVVGGSASHSNKNLQAKALTHRSASAFPSYPSTPATSAPNTPALPQAVVQPSQRQGSSTSIASNASFSHPVNPFHLTASVPQSDRYPSHTTISTEVGDLGPSGGGDGGQGVAGASLFQAAWSNGGYSAGSAGQALVEGMRGEACGVTGWEDGGGEGSSAQAVQAEYVRQRGIVLQELQQAKAEAEEERRKILARIGSRLVDGAWR